MALRFVDGFDHYATANIIEKWTVLTSSAVISAGNGRRGSQSLRCTAGATNHVTKTLDSQASWVVGFAFRPVAIPSTATKVMQLLDAGIVQVDLILNADGTLSVTRNGTSVTGGTSSNAMSSNTYYYVEYLVTIASSISAHTWKVNVGGVNWIDVTTGQSSKNTANTTANQVRIGNVTGSAGTVQADFDDLYVLDGNDSGVSGNPCNAFLGDVAVSTLYPASAGNHTAWTPGAGSNYAQVNETLADGDTTYVETGAAGNIDSYTYGNLLGSPASVFGVAWNLEGRKTDASTYSVRRVFRASSTDNVEAVDISLPSSYTISQRIMQAQPISGSQWVSADLQGAEFGVKLQSVV